MSRYELAVNAGLLIGLVGVVLTVRLGWVRWQAIKSRRLTRRIESLAELAAPVLVFGGLTVEQVANFASHLASHRGPRPFALSIVATSGIVLMFGVLVGRLFARWQLRVVGGLIDGKTGAIRPYE